MNTDEKLAAARAVLNTVEVEIVTLLPRLIPSARNNLQELLKMVRATIKDTAP